MNTLKKIFLIGGSGLLVGFAFTAMFIALWNIGHEPPVECEWKEETPGGQTKCFYFMEIDEYGRCLFWEYVKGNDGSGGGFIGCEEV